MAKVMLVEDDNNLREIYEARLAAEGYQIVSAQDGEEALALAVKEKPDLIVADIMMPKVSGFDMLDILRTTPETKNAKIIMMTALSQAEDKARAEKLGADRYLVKSQVTLEDVVNVAHELLEGTEPDNIAGVPVEKPEAPAPEVAKTTTPVVAAPPAPVPAPTEPPTMTPTSAPAVPVVEPPKTDDTKPVTPAPEPQAPPTHVPEPAKTDDAADDTSAKKEPEPQAPANEPPKVVEPARKTIAVTDASDKKESTTEEKPAEVTAPSEPSAPPEVERLSNTTASEEAELEKKVESIISSNPTLSTSADPEKDKSSQAKETVSPAEPPKQAPEHPNKPGSDADQTIANAVDTLSHGPDKKTPHPPTAQQPTEPEPAEPAPVDDIESAGSDDDDGMKHTKVIQPLENFSTEGPNLNELLAKEGVTLDDSNSTNTPGAHTVITPDGGTLNPPQTGVITPQQDGSITPGSPNNIAL